ACRHGEEADGTDDPGSPRPAPARDAQQPDVEAGGEQEEESGEHDDREREHGSGALRAAGAAEEEQGGQSRHPQVATTTRITPTYTANATRPVVTSPPATASALPAGPVAWPMEKDAHQVSPRAAQPRRATTISPSVMSR